MTKSTVFNSLFYLILFLCVCKTSLQSPVGVETNRPYSHVDPDNDWFTVNSKSQPTALETDDLNSPSRVKRFQGGVMSDDPFVSIIYQDNGTRISPYDPILFHGTTDIHLTREQLIWERIYQILRKRGVGNVPPGLPDQTRNLLLQCIAATRSQTSNRSLPPGCSGFSQGNGVPPGGAGGGGGFQHTHPGFEPYFPSEPFGSGGGFQHSHPSQAPSFSPGHSSGTSGHHHGPQGETRPNIGLPNRFVNPQPYRPQNPSHHSSSGGHLHSTHGNDGPPIFFG